MTDAELIVLLRERGGHPLYEAAADRLAAQARALEAVEVRVRELDDTVQSKSNQIVELQIEAIQQRNEIDAAALKADLRCDDCDNGIQSDWKLCAWCGSVRDV